RGTMQAVPEPLPSGDYLLFCALDYLLMALVGGDNAVRWVAKNLLHDGIGERFGRVGDRIGGADHAKGGRWRAQSTIIGDERRAFVGRVRSFRGQTSADVAPCATLHASLQIVFRLLIDDLSRVVVHLVAALAFVVRELRGRRKYN